MKPTPADANEATRRLFLGFTELGRSLSRSFLGGERSMERLAKLLRKLRIIANGEITKIDAEVERLPLPQRTQMTKACAAGCAHCCRQRVFADIPEMLWIGHHLATEWSDEQRAALRERIARYKQEMIPFSSKDVALGRSPCPFLIDEQCSIYDVRPFVCQRHHSTNVENCKIHRFHPEQPIDIPYVPPHNYMMAHLGLGVRREFADADLDISRVELAVAAEVVLDHPDAHEKYFAGEDLFAEVRTQIPEVPTFDSP